MQPIDRKIKFTALAAGTVLAGRYRIGRNLAFGGMGNVYEAADITQDGFPLAVKVLHRDLRAHPQYLQRFLREVELCRKVSHPNVVKIFDRHQSPEIVFFTMELIGGRSLEDLLKHGPYPAPLVPKLVIEICDGLRAIHRAGIVHRDLKPANIMIQEDGSIKIIDFGVSRNAESRLTKKNMKVGSLFYLAPEIWEGKKATVKADFYALGCMIFELCTGAVPCAEEGLPELMKFHSQGKFPPLPGDAPIWMNEVVHWLTARKPRNRPDDIQQVLDHVKMHCPAGSGVQTFSDHMQHGTVRSGRAMISVFPGISGGQPDGGRALNRKTLMLSLRATHNRDEVEPGPAGTAERRGKTVMISLPRNAALIFEFEMPSWDFLFLGFFLVSLQIFDGYLTHQGLKTFGLSAEGNDLLRGLMARYGPGWTLLGVKAAAVAMVLFLTVKARRSKRVRNLVGTLSCLYLFAAVVPWIYILYYL